MALWHSEKMGFLYEPFTERFFVEPQKEPSVLGFCTELKMVLSLALFTAHPYKGS